MAHRGLRTPNKADHRVHTSTSAPTEAAAMPTVLSKPLLTAPLRAEGFISPKPLAAVLAFRVTELSDFTDFTYLI